MVQEQLDRAERQKTELKKETGDLEGEAPFLLLLTYPIPMVLFPALCPLVCGRELGNSFYSAI